MPKKWGASAKKLLNAKKGKVKRQESSSSDDSSDAESSSSSGSYSSSSDSASSQSSKSVDSSGAKIVKPVKLATLPNLDDSSSSGSSSESEFGCGTYRRREDLSVSSASNQSSSGSSSKSSSSSGSSSGSYSSAASSDDDSSYSSAENESIPSLPAPRSPRAVDPAPKSFSERLLNSNKADPKRRKSAFGIFNIKKFRKKKSHEGGDVLMPNQLDKCNPSTHSVGSRKSVGSSLPSKKDSSSEEEESSEDEDDSSEDSSGESSVESDHEGDGDNDEGNATKSDNKPLERVALRSNGGEKEKQPRRRSSVSSTSSDKDVLKSTLAPSLYDEDQANMVSRRRASLSSDNGDKSASALAKAVKESNGPAKAVTTPLASKSAKSNWGKLAKAIKHEEESDEEDIFSNVLLLAKKKREEKRRQSDGSSENAEEINDDQYKKSNSNDLFQKVLQAAREEKRRQSGDSAENDMTEKTSKPQTNDLFQKVLQAAREEKRRQSIASAEDDKADDSAKSKNDKGEGSGAKSRNKGGAKEDDQSDSDDEFEAPKLVYQRKSMKHLFDKTDESDSSGSDEDQEAPSEKRESYHADESDEESSSSEASEQRSLSTESSHDEEDLNVDNMSSDDDDELSAESQMSILTPIAEAPEHDDTDLEFADGSSYSKESVSSKDPECNEADSSFDQSVQEVDAVPIKNNVAEPELNGAEAMLTDMPDETDIALAKRKAVQKVMQDKCLSAVERNKMIQDIMAGKVDLPKLSAKPTQETPVTENQSNDSEPTGAEAMLTDMPDETDIALAKRKAVQKVMKDKCLSAVERNKRIQDIMAGRVELPIAPAKPSQDPVHTEDEEAPRNEEVVSSPKNGKSKDPARRRRRRKSVEKSEPTTEIAEKAKSSNNLDSGDDKTSLLSNGHTHTSNSTVETFDSSSDELKGTNLPDATRVEKSESETQCSLLEIDTSIDITNEQNSIIAFRGAMSTAEMSATKSPSERGLLTAMTYLLHNLDSQWTLDSFSNSQEMHSTSIRRKLGKRDRISPWSNHLSKHNMVDTLNSLLGGISSSVKAKSYADSQNERGMPKYESERHLFRCESLSSIIKEPRKPSRELNQATFDMKQSAVIANISESLLLEPFSDDDSDLGEGLDGSNMSRLSKPENKLLNWARSVKKLDPRSQIRQFFEDASTSLNAEIFTVWRPTSFDAIAKMMIGDGVGKGLEVKGKSAKCGVLSGEFIVALSKNMHVCVSQLTLSNMIFL